MNPGEQDLLDSAIRLGVLALVFVAFILCIYVHPLVVVALCLVSALGIGIILHRRKSLAQKCHNHAEEKTLR